MQLWCSYNVTETIIHKWVKKLHFWRYILEYIKNAVMLQIFGPLCTMCPAEALTVKVGGHTGARIMQF